MRWEHTCTERWEWSKARQGKGSIIGFEMDNRLPTLQEVDIWME
jgi:hypothetical protein